MWVGVVWSCMLIFAWLRGKVRVGEWCCEVVGSCEVNLVARCSVLLPCNLIRTCMCVYVCVARELAAVGALNGTSVPSYAGFFTVNKTYNSNMFFWFFPSQVMFFGFLLC